nr:MAG TPA: hypothetical protein [Caudoviricetes sp.]
MSISFRGLAIASPPRIRYYLQNIYLLFVALSIGNMWKSPYN